VRLLEGGIHCRIWIFGNPLLIKEFDYELVVCT
jgi:hypothetical protein